MNEEERFAPAFESWLHDTDVPAPDAGPSIRQVKTRLPQTRQLGRWRWLPSFRRSATVPPTTDQTTDIQPTPIPATNGHTPTVTGRTQSMFSPTKAVAVGALVFALGGVFLMAQPIGQQDAVTPGASSEDLVPEPPVEFHGTIACGPQVLFGANEDVELAEGFVRQEMRGNTWRPTVTEMSDPRLEGRYHQAHDMDTFFFQGMSGEPPSVMSGTWRIENDEGAWQGSYDGVGVSDGTGAYLTPLVGEGAYEGYIAVWEAVFDPAMFGSNCGYTVQGLIIKGELPAQPELLPSE